MYELLLRTETLLLGLGTPVLLAVGIPALLVGLVLWLGGTRYSTAIIGLLGAVVGSGIGLLVSQWLDLHPWLSMLVGAAVLAAVTIALRNVLILVLAVLVLSAVSGAGYIAVLLDRAVPPPEPPTATQEARAYQSFSALEPAARLTYVDEISEESETFADRLKAVLADTWDATGPYGWMVVFAVLAGAVIGLLLVWYTARIIIALAYSIVGTAAIFVGLQAALLGVGFHAVSALDTRRWLLPLTFITMIAVGWVWQMFYARRRPRKEPENEPEASK
jgi:hypothetical protein